MRRVLYIYGGVDNKEIKSKESHAYVYCVGVGALTGENVLQLNDQVRLNDIATSQAQDFSEAVFKYNSLFKNNKWVTKNNLSLYFLTDVSCKRTETYQCFSVICNALLIRDLLEENAIDEVRFDSCSPYLVDAIISGGGSQTFLTLNTQRARATMLKLFVAACIFFVKALCVIGLSSLWRAMSRKRKSVREGRAFLTRFPLHLNFELEEDKYGDLVHEDDTYIVSVLTDGLHQNLSLSKLWNFGGWLHKQDRVLLLEDFLVIKDLVNPLRLLFSLSSFSNVIKLTTFHFKEVDISLCMRDELMRSLYRVPRLLIWEPSIGRLLSQNHFEEWFYYLHEYSYGRLILYSVKTNAPYLRTVGFQHGPASLRKLVYFAARGELKPTSDYFSSFPVPDSVMAEDEFSRKIYERAGYRNVEVMDQVYRLRYIDQVSISRSRTKFFLIAPGLHDGDFLLRCLRERIEHSPNIRFMLKPHPRANNSYVGKYSLLSNLGVYRGSIQEALGLSDRVFATYSSVAIEATRLSIPVEIIEIPGRVNESPLIDVEFMES